MNNASKKTSVVNWKGIATLVVVLAVADIAIAFIASPFVTRMVQESINRATPAKIYIQSARLHPFLLSVAVTDFEVLDPDNASQRVFKAGHASFRIDPVSLLRKRIDVANARFSQIELAVVRDATGKVNIEKFQFGKKEAKTVWDTAKQAIEIKNSDWFQRLYSGIKRALKNKKDAGQAKKEYNANVKALEKGRIVTFESPDDSVFTVRHLDLTGGVISLEDAGRQLPSIRDIDLDASNFKLLRSGGVSFSTLSLKGKIPAERSCSFDAKLAQQGQSFTSDVNVRDLDMAAFRPFYENSLPVSFNRGFMTLESKSRMELDRLESSNHLKIDSHELVTRKQFGLFGGAPDAVVAAINAHSPLDLHFQIGGTPDNPSFDGFQKELMKIVGEELKSSLVSGLKEDPGKKLGEWSDKIKSLF